MDLFQFMSINTLYVLFFFIGRPQPEVRWMVNGVLVDDQYEHNTGDVIENRLLWPSIQRTDLNSIFTCQAINTQLVEPRENSYILDLHRKCFYLKISNSNFSMKNLYSVAACFMPHLFFIPLEIFRQSKLFTFLSLLLIDPYYCVVCTYWLFFFTIFAQFHHFL